MAMREQLAQELEPLRQDALKDHPWREGAIAAATDANWMQGDSTPANRMPGDGKEAHRIPGARSRWSAGKDLAWEAVRPERVCEVKYDHLQADRFRHAATFLRWRVDKPPQDCRYDQLEVTPAFELKNVFGAGERKPKPKA